LRWVSSDHGFALSTQHPGDALNVEGLEHAYAFNRINAFLAPVLSSILNFGGVSSFPSFLLVLLTVDILSTLILALGTTGRQRALEVIAVGLGAEGRII
jgi:hypothetical protein